LSLLCSPLASAGRDGTHCAQLETRAPLYRRMSELALFDIAVAAVVACNPSKTYKDVVSKVDMPTVGLPAVILSQSLPRRGCEWRLDALFGTAGECGRDRRPRHTPVRPTKQGTHDTIKTRRIACLQGPCCGVPILMGALYVAAPQGTPHFNAGLKNCSLLVSTVSL
jgi:hypothetical protein